MKVRNVFLLLIIMAATTFSASAQRVAGYLNDSGVRMRDKPSLDGRKLGSLTLEERVELLDISSKRMKIDDMSSIGNGHR